MEVRMKNILVLVHDDAGQEARLQAALDLTRALDGHLTCLDIVQFPAMLGDYYDQYGGMVLLEEEKTRERLNRIRLEDRLAREDVRWEFRAMTGYISDCLIAESGMADLLVVNRKLDDIFSPDMSTLASKLAIKSGKPIFAVPQACKGVDTGGRAVIAWDGSLPAMAALSTAVPLLKLASDVRLLEIGTKSEGDPIDDAAVYLSRNDIHATVHRILSDDNPARTIQWFCSDQKASYCVMGASGHGRVRSAVLGSVAWRMLTTSEIPLLMAR
jgi:nucleotide-binding universal stress UspA family protein